MRQVRTPSYEQGIVWSDETGPWLWVTIPGVHYTALTDDQRIELMRRWANVLTAAEVGEAHLIAADVPFDVAQSDASIPVWAGADPEWFRYQATASEWVAGQAFMRRGIWLGIRLSTVRMGTITRSLMTVLTSIGATAVRSKAESDRNAYREKADRLLTTLAGYGMPVSPASELDLARLLARPYWLDLDRAATSSTGVIEGRGHVSELHQPEGTLCAAVAVVDHTDLGRFPGWEWLLPLRVEGVQPDLSIRFDIVGSVAQADLFDAAEAAARDQLANMVGAGEDAQIAASVVADQQVAAASLARSVRAGREPYLWPSVSITVTAPTRKELVDRIDAVSRAYRAVGVRIMVPPADQGPLLMEQRPGSRWTCRDWVRKMPASSFAGGMPHATVKVGDDVGPYIGHTTWVDRTPVMFDPLTIASGSTSASATGPADMAPTVVFTGVPGSGKSATAKARAYDAAMRGASIVWLDPMSETDDLVHLPGMADRSQVITFGGTEWAGQLDPWAIYDDVGEAAALAVDLAKMMLPAISGDMETAITATADQIGQGADPSMAKFIRALADDRSTRAVGRSLSTFSRMRLAGLFTGERTDQRMTIGGRVTIIRWEGLTLPSETERPDQWTTGHRLSLAVLHASAAMVSRLMERTLTDGPRVMIMDEAGQFTRSPAGTALAERTAMMGRKLDCALWLIGQVMAAVEVVQSVAAVVFAFRAADAHEAAQITRLLRRGHERSTEAGTSWVPDPEIVARLGALVPGRCMFRDRWGRVGEVQIDIPDPDLWAAVQTTPGGAVPTGDAVVAL